jgi:DNA polymerase III subunit epsilon
MLILDTETTGLIENMTTRSDHQPEVIEFCAIDIDPDTGDVRGELDQLIKPKIAITDEITKMTNITNEMVENSPSFSDVAVSIRDIIERSDAVVAHNASFDRDVIDLEFKKLGMTNIAWPYIICTVEQTIHIKGYRLSLGDLYEHLFNERFTGAHRARVDVDALARCVVELKKRGDL